MTTPKHTTKWVNMMVPRWPDQVVFLAGWTHRRYWGSLTRRYRFLVWRRHG